MKKEDIPRADYTLSIRVDDSGYRATTDGRCDQFQYDAAAAVLQGKLTELEREMLATLKRVSIFLTPGDIVLLRVESAIASAEKGRK